MASKRGTKKNYGTIKDKCNGKFLVTFDYGVIDGKRVRQSRQYNSFDKAEDALTEHGRQMRDVLPSFCGVNHDMFENRLINEVDAPSFEIITITRSILRNLVEKGLHD